MTGHERALRDVSRSSGTARPQVRLLPFPAAARVELEILSGADLGFTTASDGVVIHGPAARGFVGQLMLTKDGGLTWRRVSF